MTISSEMPLNEVKTPRSVAKIKLGVKIFDFTIADFLLSSCYKLPQDFLLQTAPGTDSIILIEYTFPNQVRSFVTIFFKVQRTIDCEENIILV